MKYASRGFIPFVTLALIGLAIISAGGGVYAIHRVSTLEKQNEKNQNAIAEQRLAEISRLQKELEDQAQEELVKEDETSTPKTQPASAQTSPPTSAPASKTTNYVPVSDQKPKVDSELASKRMAVEAAYAAATKELSDTTKLLNRPLKNRLRTRTDPRQ